MPAPAEVLSSAASALAAFDSLVRFVKFSRDVAQRVEVETAVYETRQKLIEQQHALLEAQSLVDTLKAENRALKEKIMHLERSKMDLEEYERKEVSPLVYLYALKRAQDDGRKPKWLCPACVARREIGEVQISPDDAFESTFPGEQDLAHLMCRRCSARYTIPRHAFLND